MPLEVSTFRQISPSADSLTVRPYRSSRVWGQRHLRYLKEYHKTIYLDLLMSGRLNSYLADIEEQAQERFEWIVEQMKQAQGITEKLKADKTLGSGLAE